MALIAALLAGCSSSSTNEASGDCESGATRSCVGPAQCKGGQSCGTDGKWGSCACGAAGTGGAAGSGGASTGGTSSGGSGGGTPGPAAGYLLWGKAAGDFAIVPVDVAGLVGVAVIGSVAGCTPRALVGDGSTNAVHLFCTTNNGANVYFVEPITLKVETTVVTPLAKSGLVAVAFDWVGAGTYHVLWQPPEGTAGTELEQHTPGGSSLNTMSPPTGMRGTFIDAKKEFVLWSSVGACVRTTYSGVVSDTTLAGFGGLVCRSLVLDGAVWRMAWGSEANDTAKICSFGAEPADATVPSGSGWTADSCKDFTYQGGDWRFRGYLPKP